MRKTNINMTVVFIESILLLGSLLFCAKLLLYIRKNEDNKSINQTEEKNTEIKEEIEINRVEIDTYYDRTGEKILLSDETYGEIWIPVLEGARAKTYADENIINRNGFRFLKENAEINSIMGIDVSAHNGDLDWEALKSAGVEFAILRLGCTTYGGGEMRSDTMFDTYYREAKRVGIKVGAYYFSQAISVEEAIEEARFSVSLLEGYTLDYPLAYDWEIIYDDKARTDNVPVDILTDCTLAYCQYVKQKGFYPVIYQNKRTSLLKLDLPRLSDYDFWLAEYSTSPSYPYDWDMWQYSCKGQLPGVPAEVDLNISRIDYSQMINPS